MFETESEKDSRRPGVARDAGPFLFGGISTGSLASRAA
jgi:hypothetical protein